MKIDDLIQRIQESKKLTDEDKVRMIRVVEWIRRCINTIRDAMHRLVRFMRQHHTFCIGAGITIGLACLVMLIPFLGQFLASLTLIIGLFWSLLADLKENLSHLFNIVEMEKGVLEI